MPRRRPQQPNVSVRVVNNATGKSKSLTVATPDEARVAATVEAVLRQHWTTTSLNDNRHRRRRS